MRFNKLRIVRCAFILICLFVYLAKIFFYIFYNNYIFLCTLYLNKKKHINGQDYEWTGGKRNKK